MKNFKDILLGFGMITLISGVLVGSAYLSYFLFGHPLYFFFFSILFLYLIGLSRKIGKAIRTGRWVIEL